MTSEECRFPTILRFVAVAQAPASLRVSIEDLQRIRATLRKSRIWNKVCKALKRWAGEPPGQSLEPLPKEKANVRNLIKQAFGVVQATADFQGKAPASLEELLDYARQTAQDYGIRLKVNQPKPVHNALGQKDQSAYKSVDFER